LDGGLDVVLAHHLAECPRAVLAIKGGHG
jgi:hypothetical protein